MGIFPNFDWSIMDVDYERVSLSEDESTDSDDFLGSSTLGYIDSSDDEVEIVVDSEHEKIGVTPGAGKYNSLAEGSWKTIDSCIIS